MKAGFVGCLGMLMFLSAGLHAEPAKKEEALAPGMVNPGYHEKPDWFKNSFLDLQEDVAEATADNKRLVIYFYQDGCPYCEKLLETNFSQRDIVTRTRENFDVISLNMWGDREVIDLDGNTTTEKMFAERNAVMYTPTLVFLDESGEQVLRLNGYYPPDKFMVALDYVAGKHEQQGSISDYARQVKPERASGKLHQQPSFLQSPYDLSKSMDKPLLVLFEQQSCPACDELHLDIFQRPESIEQLERFNVVLLDMWSDTPVVTPDGKQMTAREWAKQLQVQYAPSQVFFDEGEEVFRAEAYLRSFHVQSIMDYVASGAYKTQPNFQRYIAARADELEAQGIHVDLMD